MVKNHPIKNGDCFEITEGTLHAIKGGTFLYEVQQSSDLTYRLVGFGTASGLEWVYAKRSKNEVEA